MKIRSEGVLEKVLQYEYTSEEERLSCLIIFQPSK